MPQTPKNVVMAVVILIGVITLALVAGAVVLIVANKSVPETMWTLAGTGIGALAALLVSTRAGDVTSPAPVDPQNVIGNAP
jgi:hypothetical protein